MIISVWTRQNAAKGGLGGGTGVRKLSLSWNGTAVASRCILASIAGAVHPRPGASPTQAAPWLDKAETDAARRV